MMKQGLNQREVSVDIEMGLGAPRASWPHTGMTLYRTIRFKERIQCIGPSEFTGPRESVNVIPNWEECITGNYWAYYIHWVALGDAMDDAGTKLLPRKCRISRGLYTAPHDPADSGGLRQTPADSYSGLCWCDMGQLRISSPGGVRRSPPESVESARLRRTQSSGVHWSPVLQWTSPDSAGLQQALTGEVIRDYLIKKY